MISVSVYLELKIMLTFGQLRSHQIPEETAVTVQIQDLRQTRTPLVINKLSLLTAQYRTSKLETNEGLNCTRLKKCKRLLGHNSQCC